MKKINRPYFSRPREIIGRFCSTHNTYENYVRCLRTTNVKIGFACAFGPTYVVTYVLLCLASGICDDAKSYDDRQTKACPLVSTGL